MLYQRIVLPLHSARIPAGVHYTEHKAHLLVWMGPKAYIKPRTHHLYTAVYNFFFRWGGCFGLKEGPSKALFACNCSDEWLHANHGSAGHWFAQSANLTAVASCTQCVHAVFRIAGKNQPPLATAVWIYILTVMGISEITKPAMAHQQEKQRLDAYCS